MSLAGFIADQRAGYRVPHAVSCRALEVSESWFYKWHQRRHADLVADGWNVSVNTIAASMARQGLVARVKRRRRNLTRPDKRARPFPDLLKRDFTADAPNRRWVGDMTEIPTDEGTLFLATAIDLFSRRLLGYATSAHPDAVLAGEAIKMAVATRGGVVAGVVFHSDRGSTYTARGFSALCRRLRITQSMGRVGSCFDNAAAESFFSTLEHEVLSRHHFATREQARRVVVNWVCDFYNRRRRHSSCGMKSPIDYEDSTVISAA